MSRPARMLCWLCVLCATAAMAEDETTRRERQLNAEGIAKAQAGAQLEAIALFKEAEKLVPRHAHDCNIGQAYLQLKRLPQAQLFFERCEARMGPTADAWLKELRADVDRQLSEGQWARVAVRVEPSPGEVRVPAFAADEAWRVDGKKTLWLPVGTTKLEVSAPGVVTEARDVVVGGPAPIELAFRLAPPAVAVPVDLRRPRWPIIPMAVGGAGALVGGWFLLQAQGASTQLDQLPAGQPSAALTLAARGEQQRTAGFLIGGAGLAVAAAGVALFFLLDGVPVTPTAMVTPQGAHLGLAGSF